MVQVIPDYANPCEYGYYLALNLEESFNAMMQEIGIRELHSLEENGAVVLEDGEAAEAQTEKKTNAVKKFLHDAFEKLKGLYDKAATFIKEKLIDPAVNKIRQLIGPESKAHTKIKERLSKIKTTTKDGKDKTFGKTFEWLKDEADHFNDICDNYIKDIVISDESLKSLNDKIDSAFGVKSGAKGKAVKDAIDKYMRGKEIDVTMSYIKSNFDEIWKWATNFDASGRSIGKSLKNAKKTFDKAGSTFKKSVARKDRDEAFKNTTKAIKEMSALLGHISSAVCANIRMRVADSIKIVLRMCIAAKQKEETEKKAVGESSYIPGSFQTELASLFNF